MNIPSQAGRIARWGAWPALVFTAACFVAPLVVMALVSVSERAGGRTTLTWTLDNYRGFVTRSDGAFLDALVNSIEVSVLVTALSVLAAYPLAYILAYRVPRRWQRVLLVVIVLPFWTSYVVRSYSWLLVLSENGVINQALLALGVVDAPVGMGNSRGATVLGFVHFFVMLLTLTIYANLAQIKDSYRKAAADLGAAGWQTFLYVTLPLSLPGVAVGAFLTFVLAVGDYITPQILGGGRELLLPQAIMLQIGRAADFPMASALSLVSMLVVVAAYLLFARHLRMERV
jgi:spermidine/putrescine transport system permease protein